tara:strand:+ start:115 stop:231 length:117 start_codon:yes stop_codon:yes gene_type:complete
MLALILVVLIAHNIYLQLQMDGAKLVIRAMLKMMEDDE